MTKRLMFLYFTFIAEMHADIESEGKDELLLRIPPPAHNCYMQYGIVDEALRIFNPEFFVRLSDLPEIRRNPMCLCEHWWHSEWPSLGTTQLMFYSRPITRYGDWVASERFPYNCLHAQSANIIGCSTFTESNDCVAHLWMGPKGTQVMYMKNNAILKCISGSGPASMTMPKHRVWVHKISDHDIGVRCDTAGIINMLNSRLELYRKNSQFFRQITVFGKHDFKDYCDAQKLLEGTSIKIYFMCLSDESDLPNQSLFEAPVFRGDRESVKAPPSNFECYWLAGEPKSSFLIQGLSYNPDSPQIPSASHTVCVCEENAILKVSKDENCVQPLEISTDAEKEKDVTLLPLFTTTMVTIDCLGQHKDHALYEHIDNLGTAYYPSYRPELLDVFIFHYKGQDGMNFSIGSHNQQFAAFSETPFRSGESDSDEKENFNFNPDETPDEDIIERKIDDFPDALTFMVCKSVNTNVQKEEIDPNDPWFLGLGIPEYATAGIQIRDYWKDWLQGRVRSRPNTSMHLKLNLDVHNFLSVWCPNLLRDEILAVLPCNLCNEKKDYYLALVTTCVREEPKP